MHGVNIMFLSSLPTAHDLIELQFSKLVERMNDDKFSSIKHLLLDLAMAFAPHLSKSSLASLFCYISPLFDVGVVMGCYFYYA